jgi:hypothetical protein
MSRWTRRPSGGTLKVPHPRFRRSPCPGPASSSSRIARRRRPRSSTRSAYERKRAAARFALLIPDAPSKEHVDWTLELALPLLEKAAGGPVEGIGGESDEPLAAIEAAVRTGSFDEIIISTLPKRVSRWLRRDLPSQVEKLGLPVTVVSSPELSRTLGGMQPPAAIR